MGIFPCFKKNVLVFCSIFFLSSCFKPPFNEFKADERPLGPGSLVPNGEQKVLIDTLSKEKIQFVQYGQQYTLLIPTDTYFEFNSPRLNDIHYQGLVDIVRLLKTYHYKTIYVAAFTDDVGSREHKDHLSQAQAETMVGFLWANHIPSKVLKAIGYGDTHPIGNNDYIHSSAYNRRLEIQWITVSEQQTLSPAAMTTK